MAGPNGEVCETCYYLGEDEDRCRVIAPQLSRVGNPEGLSGRRLGKPSWPRVNLTDWCGQWLESASASAGFRATGSFVTPLDTTFNITDPTNWVKYDPGNLLDGSIMDNVTLTDGVLAWDVPGTATSWEIFVSVYGSVTFPNPTTFLDITVGTQGVPYNANTTQKLQVNPQTDDLSLVFSLQGLAPVGQTGDGEMLVRGDIGLASFTSAVMQIDVQRRG